MTLPISLLLTTCVSCSADATQTLPLKIDLPRVWDAPAAIRDTPSSSSHALQPSFPAFSHQMDWSGSHTKRPSGTTLSIGSQGSLVARMQAQLARLGYTTYPIDGRFGVQTQRAVMHFQQANGLVPDGVVGAESWAMLKRQVAQAGQITVPISSKGGSLPEWMAPAAALPVAAQPASVFSWKATSLLLPENRWIAVLLVIHGLGWLLLVRYLMKEFKPSIGSR